jgi:hypothetical protein
MGRQAGPGWCLARFIRWLGICVVNAKFAAPALFLLIFSLHLSYRSEIPLSWLMAPLSPRFASEIQTSPTSLTHNILETSLTSLSIGHSAETPQTLNARRNSLAILIRCESRVESLK